jgi:hypothetical protein
MDEKNIQMIKANLESKSDEELLNIWRDNNQVEYSLAGLEAVRRILVERNIPLPEQIQFNQERKEQEEKTLSKRRRLSFDKSFFIILGIFLFIFWVLFGSNIKEALIPDSVHPASIKAGNIRVLSDIIVVGVSGILCLIYGIEVLISKVKTRAKED